MAALRGRESQRLTSTLEELKRATEENDLPASIDAHLRLHRLFYDHSGHSILQNLWNGWESKLRLYLAVDHRSYSDLQDVAVEHEGLVARVLEGDVDGFQRQVAHHFPSALQAGSGLAASWRSTEADQED
jgi:DNA-binding GntR family transcriptional regulator